MAQLVFLFPLHARRLLEQFTRAFDMSFNAGPRLFPPQLADEHTDQSRPATAVSVATSTSSFRIPGIRPTAPDRAPDPHTLRESSRPSTALVRLFAPQADSVDRSWHSRQRERDPPVPWLLKHGPPPMQIVDSSQADPMNSHEPRSSLHRDAFGWSPSPAVARAISPGPSQIDDQVRPFTASSYHRSKLVTADDFVGNYVCALIENRGTGREVGIASIERETGM